MSKGRKIPRKRERKKPSARIPDGMLDALGDLVGAASRVLWKFTEGKEDWDEWVELRNALLAARAFVVDDCTRRSSQARITDYSERLQKREAELGVKK